MVVVSEGMVRDSNGHDYWSNDVVENKFSVTNRLLIWFQAEDVMEEGRGEEGSSWRDQVWTASSEAPRRRVYDPAFRRSEILAPFDLQHAGSPSGACTLSTFLCS